MKRILSLILSVVMLLSCFAVSAVAYTTAEDPYPEVTKTITPVGSNFTWNINPGAIDFCLACGSQSNDKYEGASSYTKINQPWFGIGIDVPETTGSKYLVLDVKYDFGETFASSQDYFAPSGYAYYNASYTGNSPTSETAQNKGVTDSNNYHDLRPNASVKAFSGDFERFYFNNLKDGWVKVYVPLDTANYGTKTLTGVYLQLLNSASLTVKENEADEAAKFVDVTISVRNIYLTNCSPDLTITPTDKNGANITDYDNTKTALSTTVFEDKVAWKLGKVGNSDTTEGAFKINQLSVNVSDYNYILVNCYYTGATGLKPGSVCITGAQNITSWFTLYPHKATTNLSNDTRLTNGDINTGTWMTLVIPIYNVDITSDSRTMADNGVISELSLRLHGIGGVGADMYVSSVTFSQSSTPIVDKTVNDDVIFRGAQMSDDGTNVRFLATIDDLDLEQYSEIGFNVVTADGTQSWNVHSTLVYESVNALNKTITAAELGGKYIVAFVVEGIPASTSADFIITPYLVSADGETTTNGATATAKMVNNAIAAGAVTFN